MKINFIILALMLGSFCASAQTTITRADYQPIDGEIYGFYAINTPISSGNAGANVVWDFSNVSQGDLYNYTVTTCNGNGDCADYAGSSYYITMQNAVAGKGQFLMNDTTGELIKGWDNGTTANYVYSAPQRILKFPVVYLDTFNDSVAYRQDGCNFSWCDFPGSNKGVVDGYGTLKTLTGVYTNVLRYKYVVDFLIGSAHDTHENYFWFQAGISHPVMKLVHSNSNPDNTLWYTTSSPKNVGGTAIEDVNDKSSINVFPNPAKGFFEVTFESQEVNNVSVKDLLGKTIFTKEINSADSRNNTINVNTSGWAKGIYLVEVATANGSLIKKIVVE